MKVTAEKIDNQKMVLEVEVPAEEVSKATDKAYKKVAGKVNIPGFRKGKAPRKIVEHAVGKQAILEEAFDILAPTAFTAALDDQHIEPVARPEIEIVTLEEGKDLVFKATVTPKPELTLGQYKDLKVETPPSELKDEDIDSHLMRMLDRQADMVDVPEGTAAADGNFVTLDFKGFIDGEAFKGGEGKDYPLQLGSNSFIPGFESQLVGVKIGEEHDVKVTFPEDYQAKELAGKAAVFQCTIRSIKNKVVPALDDEFAKKVSTFQTLDELKSDIRKKLSESLAEKAQEAKKEAALQLASDNATVDIPSVMVDNRVTAMIQELSARVEQQGLKLEQYMQYAGTDIAKLRENYRETAEKNVKVDLMLEQVAKAENIKIEADDLEKAVADMAKSYGATVNEVKKVISQQGRLGDFTATVLRQKTAQFVVDNIAK